MADLHALTMDEIFAYLENCSDDEEELVGDAELVEAPFSRVVAPETCAELQRSREETAETADLEPAEAEEEEEENEIELPIISTDELEAMGVVLPDIVDVALGDITNVERDRSSEEITQSSPEITLTKKKEIKWKARMASESRPHEIAYIPVNGDPSKGVGTPYSYFRKYLTDSFFENAALYTNMYALQKGLLHYFLSVGI